MIGPSTPVNDPEGDDLVPLSALNALLYCPRRAALRHLDGLFIHNVHTRSGDLLHRHADHAGHDSRPRRGKPDPETPSPAEGSRRVRIARGLWIASRRLRLYGRADLVEFRPGSRKGMRLPFPVEYKHGRRRKWSNDDVQLCAQALCLEEMLQVEVPEGAIHHGTSRARRTVAFTPELRAQTEDAVARLHALLAATHVPPPVLTPRCRGCSLRPACLPELLGQNGRLEDHARRLFQSNLSDPSSSGE